MCKKNHQISGITGCCRRVFCARPVGSRPAGILYAHTLDIRDVDGLPFTGETTGHIVFDQYTYQWIRVDGNSETNIGKDSQEAPSC